MSKVSKKFISFESFEKHENDKVHVQFKVKCNDDQLNSINCVSLQDVAPESPRSFNFNCFPTNIGESVSAGEWPEPLLRSCKGNKLSCLIIFSARRFAMELSSPFACPGEETKSSTSRKGHIILCWDDKNAFGRGYS
nr:hypothetical protein Iba_chr08dCG12040 [Ipomoea batatas]